MKKNFQSEIDHIITRRGEKDYVDTITLGEKIKERVFTIKDLGVNYRWLDHWNSKGLLLSNYDTHKWKKFDLIEYVWIKIIQKIREFNMSLKVVADVKEILDGGYAGYDLLNSPEVNFSEIVAQFAPSVKTEEVKRLLTDPELLKKIGEMQFNSLKVIITDILLQGSCYSIILNPDGGIIIVKFSYLELISDIPEFKNLIYGSFVSISITEILRDYILEKELLNKNKKRLALLTEEEIKVLNTIRQNDLKSVIVKFDKNKKISFLEEVRESKIDKAARLAELILAKGYHDITIKTQNGEIVYCENKKKTMI